MQIETRIGRAKAIRRFRFYTAILLLPALALMNSCSGKSGDGSAGQQVVLARVEVPRYLEDVNLPVYLDLKDGNDTYYALVIASINRLNAAGVSYTKIDEYTSGTRYLVALEDEDGDRAEAAGEAQVLYDDGKHIIVRYRPGVPETLSEIGFDLKLMSDAPINSVVADAGIGVRLLPALSAQKTVINPTVTVDAKVQAMINAVSETRVTSFIKDLSGESQITVGGAAYTITTRHTESGTPLANAIQYVSDRLTALGLTVSTPQWTFQWYDQLLTNKNVVGEITGQDTPDEIIILIAHLDSIAKPEDGAAPGADDDASGCAALLEAASIMKAYTFGRTVRFVFTTGEEQSIFGGEAYAKKMADENRNIVAVINLDMIGYTNAVAPALPRMQVKTRSSKNQTGYNMDLPVANTYLNVVSAYGLNTSIDAIFWDDGEAASDHSPFWDRKYPAIWLIEYAEKGFINPKMHKPEDRLNFMKNTFYTAIIKAFVGTAAHLAGVK